VQDDEQFINIDHLLEAKMADITINVKTVNIGTLSLSPEHSRALLLARDKIILLTSIAIESELSDAFIAGAQTSVAGSPGVPNGVIKISPPSANPNKYDKTDIAHRHNGNKSNALVIALVGGNVCSDAIPGPDLDPRATYVAIVGSRTGLNASIVGGVNLQSTVHVTQRRADIIAQPSGLYNMNNVYLYRNGNSDISVEERTAWNSDGTIIYSTAGGAGGNNNPAVFGPDFQAGGQCDNALGIVISDDPFFRSARSELVAAVNNWRAADADRYVSYPSTIYGEEFTDPPYPAQGSASGVDTPDLVAAYTTLGTLARDAYNGHSVTWQEF
jgi:hypothetical protein